MNDINMNGFVTDVPFTHIARSYKGKHSKTKLDKLVAQEDRVRKNARIKK